MKTLKFVLLFLILLFFFFIAFFKETTFETNLVKTILPQNIENIDDIISVANKSSSIVKVIIENDKNLQKEFLNEINKDFFELNTINTNIIIEKYKKSSANFISDSDRELLKNKQYNAIYNNAINQLYNPLTLQILPFDKDPYFLLTDFILQNQTEKENDEKYSVIELKIKTEEGLSPDIINKEIHKLVKLQNDLNKDGEKIFLAGIPVHSYYTSRNSIIAINIISILSLFLIFAITYFYFKNTNIIFPVLMSISFGILAGFCAVKLCFSEFQTVTMVFSTAIIGLGIDYSYHWIFAENHDKTFLKNLTFGMITTIVPFIIFYITGIELLKQIAVFSSVGIFSIYCFVLLFYPLFNFEKPQKQIHIGNKNCKVILTVFFLFAILGFLKLNFNDSLSAFYKPIGKLFKAEKLYDNINKNKLNPQIILVTGDLEKEEKITDALKVKNIEYISLSRFFPSKKIQKENYILVQNLYKNNLKKFSNILSKKQINTLKFQKFEPIEPPEIKEFQLNKNTSIIYAFTKEPININGAKVINIKNDIEKYLKDYRIKLFKLFPFMLISVFFILCCFLGIKKGGKIILPSVIAMFFSIGLTSLFTAELNLFSIISLFLVLGFSIDYAIFGSQGSENSNNAVFASFLTTAFSFLLLSFSTFKLLNSIALILFFGIIISYLFGKILFKREK